MRILLSAGAVALATVAVVCACSSESEDPSAGSSGASSSGVASSSGGTTSSSGAASSSGDTSSSGGGCKPAYVPAESVPQDIYVLVDASGSMVEPVPGASTKWTALKNALKTFIGDAKNADVGVGLGVLPIVHAGAPASCSSDNDCVGGFGFCIKKACDVSGYSSFLPCENNGDCPNNATCGPIVTCTNGPCIQNGSSDKGCAQIGGACSGGGTPLTTSTCAKKECFLEDYDDARVPIATLPGNAATLASSIDAIPTPTNTSLTPTSAALAGSLAYTLQHASTNVDRAAVVVLVSDGSANRCAPYTGAGMATFLSAALGSPSSVKTFVVGMINPTSDPTSKTSFDAIANAGGTTAATIVTPAASIESDLATAFSGIRSAAACAVKVPGTDYAKITLRLADAPGTAVAKKTGAAACDATGGWYFDVDPATGAPKKMFLCPTTCATVTGGTKVETSVGCP